jgi:hypothetical protein
MPRRRLGLHGLLVVALVPVTAFAQAASDDHSEIRTSGSAERSFAADLALLTIEFKGTGPSVREAMARSASAGNAVRAALITIGVPADSIQSRSYGGYYYWDDRMQVIPRQNPQDWRQWDTTYVVRDIAVVRLRNLRKIGAAIDTAMGSGASRVAGLTFQGDRTRDLYYDALEEATRVARRHAEIMALAAGGHLGRLISLATDAGPYSPSSFDIRGVTVGAVVDGSGTTVVPSTLSLTVTVYGRWEFAAK